MVIQSSVLKVILGWDIPLCTPTVNVPNIYIPSYLSTIWIHDNEINLSNTYMSIKHIKYLK
jgi:hypothetical protein